MANNESFLPSKTPKFAFSIMMSNEIVLANQITRGLHYLACMQTIELLKNVCLHLAPDLIKFCFPLLCFVFFCFSFISNNSLFDYTNKYLIIEDAVIAHSYIVLFKHKPQLVDLIKCSQSEITSFIVGQHAIQYAG